jgi:hypothetical protein
MPTPAGLASDGLKYNRFHTTALWSRDPSSATHRPQPPRYVAGDDTEGGALASGTDRNTTTDAKGCASPSMETAMNTLHLSLLARCCVGTATLLMLGACSVSKATKDAVARADTRLQQAQGALGNSEGGAVELQRARNHLQQAKEAVKDGDEKPAQRHAQQAELDVELAVAKAQNVPARKAADEMQASIQQLRQEAQRSTGTKR